jgi:DNA polymerase-3 subunit gamma/tau
MISWQTYYRPQKLSELHLVRVRQQMQKLAQTGRLPQVFLFAGPKGTGKTSTARIIAAMLNSAPNQEAVRHNYQSTAASKDLLALQDPDLQDPEVNKILQGNSYTVVELDAASHRGIDDVRALQEQVYTPPAMSQVIVYILDEVHMFTTEAFNALLKVLEEPPTHAFFILATTERHKIPATISSRCTIVNFYRASLEEIQAALKRVIKAEKIVATQEAIEQIATLADGSFRDAVKFLQTVANAGDVSCENVAQYLVGDQKQFCQQLVKLILTKDQAGLVQFFAHIRSLNVAEDFFVTNFYQYLYAELIANINQEPGARALNQKQAQFLLTKLLAAPTQRAPISFLGLQLTLLDILTQARGQKRESTK